MIVTVYKLAQKKERGVYVNYRESDTEFDFEPTKGERPNEGAIREFIQRGLDSGPGHYELVFPLFTVPLGEWITEFVINPKQAGEVAI